MMPLASATLHGWRARLALDYERRGERTVLAARRHDGPLVVQKPLYPEGDGVCHTIVVHPPAGVAGGDELDIAVRAGTHTRTLLTTPGAGKWYRSAGSWARLHVGIEAGVGACVEWLPQETIIFDGALADLTMQVDLYADACFLGWDILCFGRTGSGERFDAGTCRTRTLIRRDAKPLFFERALIEGGATALASDAILARQPVTGTLVATANVTLDVLGACRALAPATGEGAVTQLPGVLVGRYLGASSEAAKHYFTQLWSLLRPALTGRAAHEPRIWRT